MLILTQIRINSCVNREVVSLIFMYLFAQDKKEKRNPFLQVSPVD